MTARSTNSWLDLCTRPRAMVGDPRAAAWCAKHAPALDVQDLWAAYSRQRELIERMNLHIDFLRDWGRLPPDQQAPIIEALQELLERLAEARGLNPAPMTDEQGQACASALAEGGIEAADVCAERLKAERPVVCLKAGK